jgi:hypothetical protein
LDGFFWFFIISKDRDLLASRRMPTGYFRRHRISETKRWYIDFNKCVPYF